MQRSHSVRIRHHECINDDAPSSMYHYQHFGPEPAHSPSPEWTLWTGYGNHRPLMRPGRLTRWLIGSQPGEWDMSHDRWMNHVRFLWAARWSWVVLAGLRPSRCVLRKSQWRGYRAATGSLVEFSANPAGHHQFLSKHECDRTPQER